MAIDIHSQIILSNELHVPKGFTEASTDQVPSKNSGGELEWVSTDGFSGPQGPAGAPGSLAIFDVVDASNPVELNTISDVDFGTELIVRQVIVGEIDIQTFYVYDVDASTIPTDGLYAVTTSMGGNTRWIAGTGAYGYAGPISTATGERFVTTKEQELIGLSGSTGLHDGAALSVGVTVGTFDISAGHGFYSDITTDYSNADSNDVVITARINIPVTNILTQPVTYISIDRTDAILQSTTYPTSSERRDAIFLGVVIHSDNTNVQFVNNLPDTSLDTTSQVHDIMTGLGFFNISGNIISPNNSNLSFNKSAGKAFKQGANFQINKKDPHTLSLIAKVLSSFRYRNQDSSEGLDITVIDPTTYDLAGTTTIVPANNNATIQRFYIFPSNEIRIQRGQEVYANLSDAVDAIGKESFNIESNIEENGLLLASIAIKKIATDLSLLADAQIFIASRFGELGSVGSSSVGTLQQGYDNSIDPEIKTNTVHGALSLQDADTPTALNILEVKRSNAASNILEVSTVGAILNGELDIHHTAIISDDHALELDVNASGFGDVKAIDIDYITGAITTGDDEAIILVNIDESLSTGGDVAALEVLATAGSASVHGVLSGVGVGPIRQLSGTFGNMTSALVNAVDRLADFTTVGVDIQMFVADNDTVTIGNINKFEEIEFLLAIFSSQTIQPTFEFSTGIGTWTVFTPVDGTNGMRNNGVIAWLDSDVPTWAIGLNSEYLIRITRTRNGVTTPPIESLVQIAEATEYFWNAEAKICASELKLGAGIFADNILDEDDLISNSPTALASQQSIKAYVDASAGGGGDVIGPATSVDQSISRFNGTNNKTIEDSKVLIDDDGRISQTGLGTSTYVGLLTGVSDTLSSNANTGFGYNCLNLVTINLRNSAFGYSSLRKATGPSNTAFGAYSGYSLLAGLHNVFMGDACGFNLINGDENTYIGYGGGNSNTEGNKNVCVGWFAGAGASGANSNNVFLGADCARNVSTGSDNIILGHGIDLPTATTNSHLNIGGIIEGDISTGNIGLGTSTPTNRLELKGSLTKTITGTTAISGGTPTMTGSGTLYLTELSVGCAVDIIGEIFTVTAIASNTSATLDSNHSVGSGFVAITTDQDMLKVTSGDDGALFRVDGIGGLYCHSIKKGTSQALAGANVDELWVDTATNAIKIGI